MSKIHEEAENFLFGIIDEGMDEFCKLADDLTGIIQNAIDRDRKEREVTAIETDKQHEEYLAEAKSLMDVTDADRAKRLKLLASLIENYEDHKYPELHTDTLSDKLRNLSEKLDGSRVVLFFHEDNVEIRGNVKGEYVSVMRSTLESSVDSALEETRK